MNKNDDNTLYCGRKLRLYPTARQRKILLRYMELYRYVYNWAVAQQEECYKLYKAGEYEYSKYSFNTLCKLYTDAKNNDPRMRFLVDEKFPVGTARMALKDVVESYRRFFEGYNRHPKFIRKHRREGYTISFKTRKDKAYFEKGKLRIEGFPPGEMIDVRTNKFNGIDGRYNRLSTGQGLCEVRIIYDTINDEFWVGFGMKHKISDTSLKNQNTTEPIGVDLGHRTTFTLSTGEKFVQPKQTNTHNLIRRLDARRSRDAKRDRKIIRKQIAEGKTNPYYVEKSKRRQKRDARRLKAYRKIHNVKMDFYTKTIKDIVTRNPKVIGIETIKIIGPGGLAENKNRWKNMVDTSFYTIRKMFEHFCFKYDVPLHESDSQFPSSQLCNNCGNRIKIPVDQKIYHCNVCGYTEDRDINAAKNLVDDALGRVF